MGSVKHTLQDDSPAGRLHQEPKLDALGLDAWQVTGNYSVKDLKKLIPEAEIPHKREALAMMNGAFFEYLAHEEPATPTCYAGLVDHEGKIVDTRTLLQRGETSSIVAMMSAHTPESYAAARGWNRADAALDDTEKLVLYRHALANGRLKCGVSDVEWIFRDGLPLGSSVFKKIFTAVRRESAYAGLATYEQVARGIEEIRALVQERGLSSYPDLEKILQTQELGEHIPLPGALLPHTIYNTTSKFEKGGDRDLQLWEEMMLSGFDEQGYAQWRMGHLPRIAAAQGKFARSRGVVNIDGKVESVALLRKGLLTDFACTIDENRLMIVVEQDGVEWAIPSNKEIARALYTEAGVERAISEAKAEALHKDSTADTWHQYFPSVLDRHGIELREVSARAVELQKYAAGEVGNRILGQSVFDVPPVSSWVGQFLPYASKLYRVSDSGAP